MLASYNNYFCQCFCVCVMNPCDWYGCVYVYSCTALLLFFALNLHINSLLEFIFYFFIFIQVSVCVCLFFISYHKFLCKCLYNSLLISVSLCLYVCVFVHMCVLCLRAHMLQALFLVMNNYVIK